MRTTVTLDEDVYQAAERISLGSGERLGKVMSRLMRRGLSQKTQSAKSKGRFPTFNVPPDAPLLDVSRIQKVVDDQSLV